MKKNTKELEKKATSSILTTKQKEVLVYIKKFQAENKYPPSVRQICSAMNLKSPATVHVHINHLINKGYLVRSKNGNHLLELLTQNEYDVKSEEVINVAFINETNINNIKEEFNSAKQFFALPTSLIPEGKEVIAFKMMDNSMINAGINKNDILIIEKCKSSKNGNIILTLDEENNAIIRTIYKEENYYRLQPENDLMTPIILNKTTILGKVIGLYRKF